MLPKLLGRRPRGVLLAHKRDSRHRGYEYQTGRGGYWNNMHSKPSKFLESHRVREGPLASDKSYGCNGAFEIPYNDVQLMLVVSNQEHWDHVSVHTYVVNGTPCGTVIGSQRTPTWDEMDYVRKLLFRGDEWVLQYHAPLTSHIEDHPHVLHMWRPQDENIPVPPRWMV